MDYPGLKVLMEMKGVKKKDQPKVFTQLQIMESACLEEWARDR